MTREMARRIAVVLFNLGGPDRPEAIRPFLFNLFNDKAIIGLPQPLRAMLASLIAARRTETARRIYEKIGGQSPILEETRAQGKALKAELEQDGEITWDVFIAMRYWHPTVAEAMEAIRSFAPDEIVLLPLYPQYSTTTTASSIGSWKDEAFRQGLSAHATLKCCYPTELGFVGAQADLIRAALNRLSLERVRILFSAHGLPQRIVDRGDPYPRQVAATVRAVIEKLEDLQPDWAICYQSRVGPLKWIGPSVEEELRRAATDKVGVVIVPIAFVSEHSETLVELDIEYRALAKKLGISRYERVPTVSTHALFIAGLAELVRDAIRTHSESRSILCTTPPAECVCEYRA